MTLRDRVRLSWEVLRGKALPDIYGIQNWNSYGGGFSTGISKDQLLNAYRSWVYACVSARAKAIAAATFRLYVKRGPDEFEEIDDHPMLELLEEVNPYHTRWEMFYLTSASQDLTGDAYWYLANNKVGVPGEVWPLDPGKMKVVPDKREFISHYELRQGREVIRFESSEILHFKFPNPQNPFYGMGPVEAAVQSIDADYYQHEYNKKFYENSAMPVLALMTDQKLSEVNYKRVKQEWQKQYGGKDNVGKTAVLDAGLKVQPIGVNPKDLDWLATNKASRDDVLGIFGVPASKLGIVEDVNRANAEANDYTFSANVIEPILSMMDQRMTQDLARKYDPKLIVMHDSTIRSDERAAAEVAEIRIRSGQTTINEERKSQGFKPIEGGDELRISSNLVTIGSNES